MSMDNLMERCAGFLGYLFFVCVALMGFEVVARYIFNSPTIWVHELTVMIIGANFALGGIFVLYDKAHIAITVIYDKSSKSVQKILDILISLISTGYLSVLAYASWIVMMQSWKLGERSGTAWNPPLPIVLKTALFISAAVMAIIATCQLIAALRRLRGASQ